MITRSAPIKVPQNTKLGPGTPLRAIMAWITLGSSPSAATTPRCRFAAAGITVHGPKKLSGAFFEYLDNSRNGQKVAECLRMLMKNLTAVIFYCFISCACQQNNNLRTSSISSKLASTLHTNWN